jgi:Ser/Thr protein kinase RdoA (MazF antagonist)
VGPARDQPGGVGRDPLPAFPTSYSTLAGRALGGWLAASYGHLFEAPPSVRLYRRGLNDTYMVDADADGGRRRFVLRVYRSAWRSASEVAYELDAISHLRRAGVPVAAPIERRDGRLAETLDAPEGPRQAVLFEHAPGRLPARDEADYARYGRAAAALHDAAAGFASPHARFRLDLRHLLAQPLDAIRPFLADRPQADRDRLARVADRLRGLVERAAPDLEASFCHGDLNGGNAHLDADEGGPVTFFDFDCCGEGWRAYDVAVFRYGMELRREAEPLWRAFLEGYRSRRALSEAELAAVPALVAVRDIWLRGLQAGKADDSGDDYLNERYWTGFLDGLEAWCRKHVPGIVPDGDARP